MSQKKGVARLSLLAGSSLVAASLSFATVAFSPSAAMAANECGDPSANGATADTFICASPPTYATGVDYSTTTNGNLTLYLQNRFDTGTTGTGGIRLFGQTGESMSLLREDNPLGAGDPRVINTTGRAIDITTLGTGSILINLTDGDPTSETSTNVNTGTAPIRITGSTDAIRAEAFGTGGVTVSFLPTGTPSGVNHPVAVITAGATALSNGSGILARTTTGAINLDTRGATFSINGTNGGSAIDAVSTSGNVTISTGNAAGRLRGILAQTGGTGTISLTVAGSVSANGTTGLAGIDTVAGTGATTINITGSVSGGAGAAIRSVSASTSATSAVNVQSTGSVSGRVDFSGVTAGGVTFNTNGLTTTSGRWTASGSSIFSAFNDTVSFVGTGAVSTAANTIIDLGAGDDTFTWAGTSAPYTLDNGTQIIFGSGNDILNARAPRMRAVNTALSFGAGADTMNLSGTMVMDGLTVSGLENLNLSGVILMGGGRSGEGNNPAIDYITTDALADDVFIMTDGTFNGAGGRVVMDYRLDLPQEGCATLTGAADCLDLRGASSSGETLLTLNYIGDPAFLSAFSANGITLVDMAGAGASAQGHFVIDPNTAGYVVDPMFGGVLTRAGLFQYGIRYDPVNNRHVLTGLPRSQVLEYTVLSSAASSIWHMTAETVNERQTDLRAGTEGVVWLRTTGEYTKRNVSTAFDSFGETFLIDNGYKLYAGTIMGGMDFAAGTSGGYDYVVGGQIGYVGSSFDLNASESSGRFSGATGGVYGSIWTERFFLDGTFNMNGLTLDYDSPGLGSKTNTFVNAFGARLDGGMRHRLTETIFAEPLASVAFVRTSFEEISLSGGEIQPADAQSRRAALGLRVGADFAGASVNWSYFLTGRAWNEFDGESGGAVHNPGVDLPFADDFSGTFGEAEAGLGLANDAGTVSGFLASGVKFKDGYSAVDLSGGLRLRW